MGTRQFNDLASEAQAGWSDDARVVHRAAAESYRAELEARQELGRQLAGVRGSRRMTQPALAEAAGVQQAEISRIERGRANPTYATLHRLAAALGVTLTFAPAAPSISED
ncbi:helix-turn-helix domain-containing protein [Rothia sp. AR01]|uniref:Helix-turn-helix domain-containing protein n=1 Tax=Rothia santali TaxID=2949643 RepID=A0A9X2HJ48_9MICC|nr:helix-turn-helix transcriptional regulator [Rothia santali]MCP3426661.1 helix-turn-helix domain-containing protein [Rothia santali]